LQIITAVGVCLSCVIVLLRILAGSSFKEIVQFIHTSNPIRYMLPGSLYLLHRMRIAELRPKLIAPIRYQIAAIHGTQLAAVFLQLFLAKIISIILLLLITTSWLSVLANSSSILWIGVSMAAGVPIFMKRDLSKMLRKKKLDIIIELPEFLSGITLLVNAGETVQKAIIRCVQQKSHLAEHPLFVELRVMTSQLNNNYSFQQAMDEFGKRCGIQEVSVFVSTVLINYRRGGEEFAHTLRALSRELWERRKAAAKTLGEEASSKMVFPMVFVFVLVMIIVAAPAMMLM
jgi:tight adherence protein C